MKPKNNITRKTVYLILVTVFLLLIPFTAMQFSEEIVWSPGDFLLAGILLFGTGISYVLITQKSANIAYRIAVGMALFSGLFLIWSNLAVGIIGSEYNLINLWYFGVIIVGIVGTFLARYRPYGMALTMLAMIIGLVSITTVALIKGMHNDPASPMLEILGINALFVILFTIAGLLFRYAINTSSQDDSQAEYNVSVKHPNAQ